MNFSETWLTNKELSRPVLGKILETMREGVIIVSENMRILASNTSAYNSFARSNGALENRRLSEVIRDVELHEAFRKALEDGVTSDIILEIPRIKKRKFDVHVVPIEIEDTKNAVGVFYDITKIEYLEKVRQEFLSNISHELRTPLTSIIAFVETLEDGAINDEENNRRFLSVIRKNAERMHLLIDDIRELSSIESGQVKIEVHKVNLARHVQEVFTNLSTKAAEREVELINKVPEGTSVYVDVIRLEQMLTNLIDNAIKFNRNGGTVRVSHRQVEGMDEISITDTGEGISGSHLQRIFERFYRADRARSREIGGTGLGLAIVKHLVLLHGGEVSAESTIGEGTTFLIKIPANAQVSLD